MIDLHCHVLPGIDDGPLTTEGSLALARAAAAAGTRTLVATPHVSWGYPNDADTIARLVKEVNTRLAAEPIALDVRPGAEIAITRVLDIEPAQLARLGLGGGPWLLIEPPFAGVTMSLSEIVRDLQRQGHRIVLAHPERCQAFHDDPGMLDALVRDGAITSITAGSLVGQFGESVRRFALQLAHDELIHNVVSDAHDDVQTPAGRERPARARRAGAVAGVADRAGSRRDPGRRRHDPAATRGGGARSRHSAPVVVAARERAYTSFVIATIIPISTTITIATCVQNQVGGTADEA